jgi:hypothetical protein
MVICANCDEADAGVQVYLLNHLNGHLADFLKSEEHARLKQTPQLSVRRACAAHFLSREDIHCIAR